MISLDSVSYFEPQNRCAPTVLSVEQRGEVEGGIDGELQAVAYGRHLHISGIPLLTMNTV